MVLDGVARPVGQTGVGSLCARHAVVPPRMPGAGMTKSPLARVRERGRGEGLSSRNTKTPPQIAPSILGHRSSSELLMFCRQCRYGCQRASNCKCWTTGEFHAAGPATLSIINVGRWDARALARFGEETSPPLVAKRADSVEDGALPRPGRPSLAYASGLDERLRAGMRRPFTMNQGREDWWGSLRSIHPTCSGFRRGRAQCPKPRPSLRSGTCHQLRASAVNSALGSQNPRAARMSSKSRRW